MSPITHLLVGWALAESTTTDVRARRHIVLAGAAPDLDGLGVVIDFANRWLGRPESEWFGTHHHWLLHGGFGAILAVVLSGLLGMRDRRVLLLVFLSFHLHLLCDLVGSRGPMPHEIWPIHYLGPFSRDMTFAWSHQWALNAWPNVVLTAGLIAWALHRGVSRGATPLSMVSEPMDTVVVRTLRQRWAKPH